MYYVQVSLLYSVVASILLLVLINDISVIINKAALIKN